ncbi:MAG: 50S ribosomal protein L25 [Candidatus Aminicenantes bacterium]|nr:50S ribosomal protein L25 [Candidatus Aminicenantes bacterium]
MSITIKAEVRETRGKNAARRLRSSGKLPAVLYGPGAENVSLGLSKKDIFSILKSESGENTLFKVAFASEKRDVMIKDYQQDVVTDEVLHVDLIQILLDKVVRVSVPIEIVGEAIGVKSEGGFVDFSTREVEIECLPDAIPEHVSVDISELHLHQAFKVEDLAEIEGVKYTTDPNISLVQIQAPSIEEEVEEEELEEGEIMAEGEEPEVIKKDKDEEESATGAEKKE